MDDNRYAMVLASFAADSLALGVHWIYNTDEIDRKVKTLKSFIAPVEKSWHPTKKMGEFTHYGDQTLALLKSLKKREGFDRQQFEKAWRSLFNNYQGYIDKATQKTLANMQNKAPLPGSDSTDLGGAARIAPLLFCHANNPEAAINAARQQTALTHNHPDVVDSAEFFTRVTLMLLQGTAPREAIQAVLDTHFNRAPFRLWVAKGFESRTDETRETIKAFGQMCETRAAFPGVVHLIVKYADDLQTALIENCMAGGDCASRGLITGMVLGATLGKNALPDAWLADLKAYGEIVQLLADIDTISNE